MRTEDGDISVHRLLRRLCQGENILSRRNGEIKQSARRKEENTAQEKKENVKEKNENVREKKGISRRKKRMSRRKKEYLGEKRNI